MDSSELQAIVHRQITGSQGYIGTEITEDRRKSMDAYLAEPLGNEIEGRSQVVSSDVQDVIESVMPDIMQIFTSSDKAVEFAPRGEGDEEVAEQVTDYINHIWNVDNDGFLVFHDWFKDALIQINGVIKVWWDENPGENRTTHTGLDADQVAMLLDEEGAEVIEHEEYWPEKTQEFFKEQGLDPDAEDFELPPEMELATKLHDITIKRSKEPRVRIANVAPEHFFISRRAVSLDDSPFLAHWEQITESDLIEDGYDPEQVRSIPNEDNEQFNDETTTRFYRDDEHPYVTQEIDQATREIQVYECYMRVDYDGDGIAELRKVKVAGPGHEILRFKDGTEDNEPVEDHPFCAITPIRMPHKFFGRSLADLCMDIYKIKTTVWRQLLDNMYNVNNARAAISDKVNLEDWLDGKVGAPIRVDTMGADVAGHIVPIPTVPIGNHAFPLLEYIDTIRETRTGVNRLGQGLDPDALNSTASGINQLLGRSQQRTLMIAQVFAHGVRDAFRKILRLVISHQDKPRTIRLRNEWIEMDPRSWDAEMDVQVNVGLGRGTQEQKVITARMVVEATLQLLQIQGGIGGPFVFPHHVREAFGKLYEVLGLKSADPFLAELGERESQQVMQQIGQQEDPETEAKKAELQLKGQELQVKAQEAEAKLTLEFTKEQNAHIQKMIEMGQDARADEAKLQLDAFLGQQKLALEQYKVDKQAQVQKTKASSD